LKEGVAREDLNSIKIEDFIVLAKKELINDSYDFEDAETFEFRSNIFLKMREILIN
jgi:hypothetical protein